MAKTPSNSRGPPPASALPGLGGAPRDAGGLHSTRPSGGYESSLAKTVRSGAFPASSGAPTFTPAAIARAREARRWAGEGVRLIRAGRPAEAVAALKRSVKLDPDSAASHFNLGLALMATGRLEEAAESLASAIRLDPRMPFAHHHLAQIFDGFGQEAMAMAGYNAAVALKPDLIDAQMRLGDLFLARGLPVQATAAFGAASAAAAGTVTARIAQARGLEAAGDFDAALAAMRAAVEAHPESGEAGAILANLLSQAGLSAEAAAQFERASELTHDLNSVWIGVTTNRKITDADSPLIARMNAALGRPGLTPRHRQLLHFALGKAHDDREEYEAAMRNFDAGNQLRALGGRLDRDGLARRVAEIIHATPSAYRDGQAESGIDDASPILIVGMPRSGSTLTEQILSSHPEVAAAGELGFWSEHDVEREDFWSIVANPTTTRALAGDYLTTLRAFGPEAKRVTDKALANFFVLGAICRVFPNATFIHCRRHPIDTALSIFTTNFETNFDYASDRGDLVFYYRQYQRLMAHWRAVLPPDRFVEVDYEALVAEPELHARRLIAACGLEWNDACLAPHRNVRKINTASVWQARQPIYRTSVERWRRYEPWLGELRELGLESTVGSERPPESHA
jgi:tetratricopeptide (TPR) repeat protein